MRNIVLAILFALLNGCAGFVQTKVTVFHELEQPLSGVTYVVIPNKEQEDSLEFQSYAKLVKSELRIQSMTETPFRQAKYAIFIFYGIDNGKQEVSSYPIFGQTGIASSYTTGMVRSYGNTATYSGTTYITPTYGVVGSGTSIDTVFTRYLNIEIVDIAKSSNGKVHKVYEGKALSMGSSSQIALVIPAMVQTIFEDFPGKSGATRTSRHPLEK